MTSGEMALATLASAISQDIIILMTLPIWSSSFFPVVCKVSAPDFQSHYTNDILRNGTSHPGQCHFSGHHDLNDIAYLVLKLLSSGL